MQKSVSFLAAKDINQDLKESGVKQRTYYTENKIKYVEVWIYTGWHIVQSKKQRELNRRLGLNKINYTKQSMTRKK